MRMMVVFEKGKTLRYTEEGLAALCKAASGGKFGARDLRRVIRKQVEDEIAAQIVSQSTAHEFVVDAKDEKVTVTAS